MAVSIMFSPCLSSFPLYDTSPAAVVKHFDDFQEDQFDFHSYCLRKVTLRAYVSVLRFEDVIYGQPFFCEAAAGIIRIYLHLNDIPTSNEMDEPDYSTMDAAERKKAKAIARKKKKATEKKETEMKTKNEETVVQNGSQKTNQKSKGAVIDDDPLGLEYLKKTPLDEAKKYSSMLAKYAPKNLATWILQYDVAMRRKKPMLALQSLFKARALDIESSELFVRIVDFSSRLRTFDTSSVAVRAVIAEEAPVVLGMRSLVDFIKDARDKIRQDPLTGLSMRTAVTKALVDANIQSIKDSVELITDGGMEARNVSVETCLAALDVLMSFGSESAEATNNWREAMRRRFPTIV
jgi:NMDA receptor-regulated protein 1